MPQGPPEKIDLERLLADLPGLLVDLLLELDYAGGLARQGFGGPPRDPPSWARPPRHSATPRREETALRDVLQRLAVAHRRYGYRRLTALVRRQGWAVNHKRILRLMRTDNLLGLRRCAFVPATTDSRHRWRVVPNLTRSIQLTGLDQLWSPTSPTRAFRWAMPAITGQCATSWTRCRLARSSR
jgi:transposase InsO family protein